MKEKGECFPDPILNTPIGLYSRHGHTPEEEGGVSFTDCTVVDDRPARPQPGPLRRCLWAVSRLTASAFGQRPWLQAFGDANPQVPHVPYPPSKNQGLWTNVNMSNVAVHVLSKSGCTADVKVAAITSRNVSCEPGKGR